MDGRGVKAKQGKRGLRALGRAPAVSVIITLQAAQCGLLMSVPELYSKLTDSEASL